LSGTVVDGAGTARARRREWWFRRSDGRTGSARISASADGRGFADGVERDCSTEVGLCIRTAGGRRPVPTRLVVLPHLLMLLVLDVGNTNTVLGVFTKAARDGSGESRHYELMVANWRVATIATQTVDEYGVLFRNLFAMDKIEVQGVHGIIISSVVPPVDSTLRQVCERYFNTKPLFIEPGVKTGMPVLYDNPAEVGADRIVNSVAAFEKFGGPCISVDFGTATTFDCVSAKGEYIGGVICPGLGISADALFENTARLPRVDIRKPARVIGSPPVGSVQSGLYYGYLGLVDGILERLLGEMG